MTRPSPFADAVYAVWTNGAMKRHKPYQDAYAPADILEVIRLEYGADAWPLCTVIDVADEMNEMFGPSSR